MTPYKLNYPCYSHVTGVIFDVLVYQTSIKNPCLVIHQTRIFIYLIQAI